MDSILEAFASVEFGADPRPFKNNPAFEKLAQRLSDVEEKLLATISDPEKELLAALCEAQGNLICMEGTRQFVTGYRLGALMMIDVFAGRDAFVALR